MQTRTVVTKRYAAIAEVAEFTGLSQGTVRCLLATGELTALRPVPGRVLIDLCEVERFMKKSAKRDRGQRGRKPRGIGIDQKEGGQ